MRSLPDENRPDLLRARYVELLRLREYVQGLEDLRKEKRGPDRTMEGVEGRKKLLMNAFAKHGSNAVHRTI